MKNIKIRAVLSGFVTLVATFAIINANASAAAPAQTGNGLRVSPVRNDLTINRGSSQTVPVTVENLSGTDTSLQAILNDFVASNDETGVPRVLLDSSTAPKHGLKQYIKGVPNFTVKANSQVDIPVTISIPNNARAGGYFGAVRFTPVNAQAGRNVSLSASVGSLFLVTVPGQYTSEMSVSSFNVANKNGNASNFVTNGSKLQSVVRFHNTGDVQEQPFGKVILKKGGKTLGEFDFNNGTPRSSILPDSIRRFEVDLQGKAKSFGKYTVIGAFGYGTAGATLNAETSFYVIPLPYIIAAIVLVLLIIVMIVVLRMKNRSHKNKYRR